MTYRETLPREEWEVLLEETKQSVIRNPTDFFGSNVPPIEVTTEAVLQVFDGFMQDIKIRRIQAFRTIPARQSTVNLTND
jgi:hypothetical protein